MFFVFCFALFNSYCNMFIEAVVGLTIMALLAGSSADCSAPLAAVPSPAGLARDGLETSTTPQYHAIVFQSVICLQASLIRHWLTRFLAALQNMSQQCFQLDVN